MVEHVINSLGNNAAIFSNLFTNPPGGLAEWKPGENKWALIEILNHLCDEEREDFRCRLDLTLGCPEVEWPPINPGAWATERDYASRSMKDSLASFLGEREKSVAWLRSLENPNWKSVHHHQLLGPMSAEMLLANWLAHDLLHIRQIITLQWNYLNEIAAPVKLIYAGEW